MSQLLASVALALTLNVALPGTAHVKRERVAADMAVHLKSASAVPLFPAFAQQAPDEWFSDMRRSAAHALATGELKKVTDVIDPLSLAFEAKATLFTQPHIRLSMHIGAGELTAAADSIESTDRTANMPAPLCHRFGLCDGTQPLVTKSTFVGTTQPVDLRVFQVVRINGRRHIIIGVYLNTHGTWYLTDDDGALHRAATKTHGSALTDLPLAEAEEPFKREKSFWISRLRSPASDASSPPPTA